MYTDCFYLLKKAKVELVQLSLNLAKPKSFILLFGLTCPNLVLTFLCRLGQPQPAPAFVLRGIGLTVPTFFCAHIHAMRKLFEIFKNDLHKVIFKRLGHNQKNSQKSTS